MYLAQMKNIVVTLLLLTTLWSCSNSNLEEEMDNYCECMSTSETTLELSDCYHHLDSLTRHYEYDPESVEYISSRIKQCPVSR